MKTFANRDVGELVFTDYSTKKPFLNLNFANVTTFELTGESVYSYGGQGHPKRVAFTGERGGTIQIETQLQTAELYALVTGSAIDTSASFLVREELTAGDDGLTVTKTIATGNTPNVYAIDDDCGTSIDGLTVSGQTISGSGLTDGDKYIVYYITSAATGKKKISVKSTTFPKAFRVDGKTWDKTEDDEIIDCRMIAYKCVPQSNISLSFSNSGDPASVTITCDLLADGDDNIFDLILDDAD